MGKRIIICCDGTWNEPETTKDGRQVPTNVGKLARAIAPRDAVNGLDQLVYYSRGVGTGILKTIDGYLGGGTGLRVARNLRDAYQFLALNYVEGDEIFCFGFSRGAHTARCLSGMLDAVGLLNKNDLDRLPAACDCYRMPPGKRTACKYQLSLNGLPRIQPKIKFLGVWDTVGAFGAPTPMLRTISRKLWLGFHDTAPAGLVENAYQALAIDERRGPFIPALWDRRTGQKNLQQVWFAGVHANVGGGYPDTGLSDIAFTWMVNRAMQHGLAVDAAYLADRSKVDPRVDGKLEDSFSPAYGIFRKLGMAPALRPIGHYLSAGEMIHESVVKRLLAAHPHYHPENIVPPGRDPGVLVDQKNPRTTIQVNGFAVPVFRERRSVRRELNVAPATLTLGDNVSVPCRVANYSDAGGMLLAISPPPAPGTEGVVEHGQLGRHKIKVVWRRENNVGVKFAA